MRELTSSLDPLAADVRAEQLDRWEAGDCVLIESLLVGRPGLAEPAAARRRELTERATRPRSADP